MTSFRKPIFETGVLELRCERDEVSIYGTEIGLRRLAEICIKLTEHHPDSATEHFHLEDYELLTDDSLRGTIAVFREPPT
jgi:hypothetical protein